MRAVVLVILVIAAVYADTTCKYTSSDAFTSYDFSQLQSKTFEIIQGRKTYFVGAGCKAPKECGEDSAACFFVADREKPVSIAKLSTAQWADSQFGAETGAEVTFTSPTPCEGGLMKTSLTLRCTPAAPKGQYLMDIEQDGCYTAIVLATVEACPEYYSDEDYNRPQQEPFATCESFASTMDKCHSRAGCIWCEDKCQEFVSPAQWNFCGYVDPPAPEEGSAFTWFWYFMAVMAVIFFLSSICTCIRHCCLKRRCCKTTQTNTSIATETPLLPEETEQNMMPDMSQYAQQVPYVYYVPTASGNGQQMYVQMIPQMMVPPTIEEPKE